MKKLREEIQIEIDDAITGILEALRDNTYANDRTRREFAYMISGLSISKDPRAREAIKKLGQYFTHLGDELILKYDRVADVEQKYSQSLGEETEMKKYKRYFSEGNKTLKIDMVVTLGKKRPKSVWAGNYKAGTKVKIIGFDSLDGENLLVVSSLKDMKKPDYDPEMNYELIYPDEVK